MFPTYQPNSEPGWQKMSAEPLFTGTYIQLQEARYRTPTRDAISWTIALRKNAVIVAPQLPDGRLILIHQERLPVQLTLWEFPAGQIDAIGKKDDPATIMKTARSELEEEAGYRFSDNPDDLVPLGYFFSSQGFTDEHAYLFLAKNVVPIPGGATPEESEGITGQRSVTANELAALIDDHTIRDANTLALYARMVAGGHL